MLKRIKVGLSISWIIIGLIVGVNLSILGGILITTAGVLLIPQTSNWVLKKMPRWSKRSFRRVTITTLFFLGIIVAASNSTDSGTITKQANSFKYQDYLNRNNSDSLSPERIENHQTLLDELKSNKIYKLLIDSQRTTPEYVSVISAISSGISSIHSKGFSFDEATVNGLLNSRNGKQKRAFVVKVVGLSQPIRGGLTKELINVFERYRIKYDYYGEPKIIYNRHGNEIEEIKHPYDFTSIFGILDPDNHEVLNAIFESRNQGFSSWREDGEYTFNHLSTKREYMQHIKQVYPKSPNIPNVDFELTANQLYREYYDNEIAADNKYKNKQLLVTGIIADIGNDILDDSYITLNTDDFLTSIQCYLNKETAAKLSKGEKVSVIGKCTGLFGTIMMKECKIWN